LEEAVSLDFKGIEATTVLLISVDKANELSISALYEERALH
jgi:hypothetical protein